MESTTQSQIQGARRQMSDGMKECIESCIDCFRSCTELIPHCLLMGGKHASASHIGLLNTCASACETAAKFMMFQSEFHHDVCKVCAEVCFSCAEECEKLSNGDHLMIEAAAQCRRCAESCQKMSQTIN